MLLSFCILVIFLVFSNIKSVSTPLRGDVLLSCGFRQEEVPLGPEVGVEWRLQHRGKGQKVLEMKTKLNGTEMASVGELTTNKQSNLLMQAFSSFDVEIVFLW